MPINRRDILLLESFSIPTSGITTAIILNVVLGHTDLITPHKSDFKRWIDYCGIFYFFIKYLRIKEPEKLAIVEGIRLLM